MTLADEQPTTVATEPLSLSPHAESLSMSRRPTQIPTEYPVFTPCTSTTLAPPSFSSRPGSPISTACRSEGSLTVDNYSHNQTNGNTPGRCRRQLITFDMLPDDVLLEIFNIYVHQDMHHFIKQRMEMWIRLVHVCRRWRSVVFQSPLHLNLRLFCTHNTPTRDLLDIWPRLPLIIIDFNNCSHVDTCSCTEDNVIAALEHNDRVCEIGLTDVELGHFTNSPAIQKPFPELTILRLDNINVDRYDKPGREPVLPDSFLGGSAPRLRALQFSHLSFPGLPKLLLTATHLAQLDLSNIPCSGYIPPGVMATTLSALISLEWLYLHFRYLLPRPAIETRRLPHTRSILPSLTKIDFRGASEYLEVILARIDAPRLEKLQIYFFNQLVFDTPQLFQFISRRPTLRTREMGRIVFHSTEINVRFNPQISDNNVFNVGIWCTPSEWQLSSLGRVCISSLPPVPTVEDLYIYVYRYDTLDWPDDIENSLWLDLLRSFVAVKNLYISEDFVPRIAPALQELVGGRTTEVFPALENIFLEGFQTAGTLQEGVEKFVAARLLTSHPVAVSRWDSVYDSDSEGEGDDE